MEISNFIIDPVEAVQEFGVATEEGVLVVKETESLQLVMDFEIVSKVVV